MRPRDFFREIRGRGLRGEMDRPEIGFGIFAQMNFEPMYRPSRSKAAVDQHCADAVDVDRSFVDRKRIEADR